MGAVVLEGHNRVVHVAELRSRVCELNLSSGLRLVTLLSVLEFRGRLAQWAGRVNSFNLPLLAKAYVLWGRVSGGRPTTEDDLLWLLRAVNSLPWHSHLAADFDNTDSVLRMIIRQAFQRYYTDDPFDARIARTWMMFHDSSQDGGLAVQDPSKELFRLLGVSAEDLWVVGFMIFSYHVVTGANRRNWAFDPRTFVRHGPHRDEINELVNRVMTTIALTPEQFRERYAAEASKYADQRGREGHWLSEFNILRDFPVVKLDDGLFAAPYPPFALTRALDGFYYDLLEEYARRKRAAGAGGNPNDNEMSTTLGTLFEQYIGRQLSQLRIAGEQLRGEFYYGPRKARRLSTDWIVARPGRLPIFFECKAREPMLDVQRYADLAELRTEIGKGIGKACGQLVKFVLAIDAKMPGLEQYHGLTEFVAVVVLQAPLPFHMIKDIRAIIEEVVQEMEPDWPTVRHRLHFVPMSARELETAVATEMELGVPIEDQLVAYARYREQVNRIERWIDGVPDFPRHLEEFLQEQYNGGRRIANRLCSRVWSDFCDYCQERVFAEGIEITDREIFAVTQKIAYDLWEKRGRPLWDADCDWYEAERQVIENPTVLDE